VEALCSVRTSHINTMW